MEVDLEKLKDLIVDAITQIFCGSKIVEYNQAKWLGFDESLDSYIQNHVVNGLGYAAWRFLLGRDPDADSDDDVAIGGATDSASAIASEDCQAIVPYTHAAEASGFMCTKSWRVCFCF